MAQPSPTRYLDLVEFQQNPERRCPALLLFYPKDQTTG